LVAVPLFRYRDRRAAIAARKLQDKQDQTRPTADQQKMSPADRAITQQIRKAIHHDASLSTYGRNIKIFTENGKVTLRGAVRSDDEKRNLEAKALTVARQGNVTNQLEVTLSK
jgi:osmotically-inducible protein OsmY